MALNAENASAIANALGLDERGLSVSSVCGGDIADSCVLRSPDCRVFVKTLPPTRAGLLSAEADGLAAIEATETVRVPRVLGRGSLDNLPWLALEYLDLDRRGERADAALGRGLAELHRNSSDQYGWHCNNYIGATPQPNHHSGEWSEFFLQQRLGFQFDRLDRSDCGGGWSDLKHRVEAAWQRRFSGHNPEPALIHGDLWCGNAAAVDRTEPVIFDPAVHFADRECDLAMTHLFGGFSPAFYQAYEQAWPLPEGHEERRPFYKLYHLLNHANLFGGPYHDSVRRLVDHLTTR